VLARDLSLHNDVLFSLLTVCQLVIDVAGERSTRRGKRFQDYTEAVRNLAREERLPPPLDDLQPIEQFAETVLRLRPPVSAARALRCEAQPCYPRGYTLVDSMRHQVARPGGVTMVKRTLVAVLTGAVLVAVGALAGVAPAEAQGGNILDKVKKRGKLVCAVNAKLPGFGFITPQGRYEGFDIDFCRALAAAIFGDTGKVEYVPTTAKERFTVLQTGEADVLFRNTTNTLSRDTSVKLDFGPTTFYDGQGMMVRKQSGVKRLDDMKNASICVQTGTTTELNLADQFRKRNLKYKAVVFEEPDATFGAYEQGRCDGVTTDISGLISRKTIMKDPAAHVILPDVMSKEPLGPSWAHGDNNWGDIVRWLVYGLMAAEEYGITQSNVDQHVSSKEPEIARMMGGDKESAQALGLDPKWLYNAVKQVGNYGEIFARNLGPGTPFNLERGVNDLWTKGGLMYAVPFR
jgi:general L-amino acid transport system substrate-binding protein